MTTNNEKIFKIVIDYQTASRHLGVVDSDLKAVNSTMNKLTKTQRELESQFKRGKVSQEEFAVKTKGSAIQLDQLRKKQYALTEERKKAIIEVKKYAIADNAQAGSITEVGNRLTALRTSYRLLSADQRNNAAVGGAMLSQIRKLATEYKKLEMSIGNTGVNAGNYAMFGKMQMMLTNVTAWAYGVKKMVATVLQPFRDFEYQMDRVMAVSGASAQQMVALEANARKLGESTEYTATQVAQLQLNYARLGFSPDEILKVTQATLDLATATGEDLAQSADIAGATLRGFGLEAKEMPRVVDVMANSFNKSALSLSYFTDSMKYVAPIAKTAGVSLEQTTAMLGILADRGIRGSQAGTALRRILTEISISGKPVSEALADLSAKGLSVSDAMDEVGRYAMTALTVLTENAPAVESLTVALNNSAGAAKSAADIMRDNLKGDTDKAISALQELAITIGEALAPVIRLAIQGFTSLVQNIATATVVVVTYVAATKGVVAAKALLQKVRVASIIAIKAEMVAINMSTMAAKRYLVTLRDASAMTKLLAAAKLFFTGNIKAATVAIKMFGVALKSTGIGLAVAAIAGLVAWYISSEKSATAAEIAQKRVNKAHEDFANAQAARKGRAEELITASKSENESMLSRVAAFRELQLLYPNILQNYTLESFLLADIAKIRKQMAESDANRKLVQDNKNLEESTKRLINTREEYRRFASLPGVKLRDLEDLKKDIEATELEIRSFYKTVQQNKADMEASQPVEVQLVTLDKQIADFKAQITELERLKGEGRFVSPHQEADLQRQQEEAEKRKAALGKIGAEEQSIRVKLLRETNERLEQIASDSTSKQEVAEAKKIINERSKASKIAKERERAQKEYDDTLKASNERILAQENAMADAQIALMDEGVTKKMAAMNQASKKQAEARQKQYDADIAKIEEQQKRLSKSSPEYQTLETGKKTLADNHEELKTQQTAIESSKRLEILHAASIEELAIYDRTLTDMAAKREVADVVAKRKARTLFDDQLRSYESASDAQIKTIQSVRSAENEYALQKRITEQTANTDTREGRRKLKEDSIKNELELLKTKADAYIAELQMLQSLGQIDTDRYNELLAALDKVKKKATGVGEGTEGDGAAVKTSMLDDIFNEFSKPENIEKLKGAAFDLASQINQAMADAEKNGIDRRLQQEQKKIDDEANSAKKGLEDKRKRGLISEKTYQKELAKVDAEADKRREAAERKAFEDKKRVDTKAAIINTALSVGKTFAMLGWPAGIVPAAIALATGAVQVATIASQKYALGGIVPVGKSGDGLRMAQVKGPSHAQGGLPIMIGGRSVGEMEGDEIMAIINKSSASRYMPKLSAINQAGGGVKFAGGGIVASASYRIPTPARITYSRTSTDSDRYTQETMRMLAHGIEATRESVDATNSRIDRLSVFVSQTDLSTSQQNQDRVKSLTTF